MILHLIFFLDHAVTWTPCRIKYLLSTEGKHCAPDAPEDLELQQEPLNCDEIETIKLSFGVNQESSYLGPRSYWMSLCG